MTWNVPFTTALYGQSNASVSFLDSVGDMVAFAFEAREAKSLAKVRIYTDSVSGSPGTMSIVLSANSAGKPNISGGIPVDIGGGSPTLVTTTSHPGGVVTYTFTNAYSLTAGTRYWVVFYASAGTWDGSNRVRIIRGTNNLGGGHADFNSLSTDGAGATWTNTFSAINSISLLDGSDVNILTENSACFSTAGISVTYADADNPDELGNYLTVPTDATVSLTGLNWLYRIASATTSDHSVRAYTNPLVSPSLLENYDVDVSEYIPTINTNLTPGRFFPSGPYTLTSGTVLGVSIKAQGAGNIVMAKITFNSQADKEAARLLKDIVGMTRNGGSGAFSAETNAVYSIAPYIAILGTTSGGGGLARIIGG